MKTKIRSIALALILMLTVSVSYAQFGVPGTGGGAEDVQDEAPISSLVILGLAVGAAVGVRKLK